MDSSIVYSVEGGIKPAANVNDRRVWMFVKKSGDDLLSYETTRYPRKLRDIADVLSYGGEVVVDLVDYLSGSFVNQ